MADARSMATFRADFPDDQVEAEEDGILVHGGRGVASALGEILTRCGYKVSAPEHMHEHGWDFYAEAQNLQVWFEVSQIEEFLLQTRDSSPFWSKLLGRSREPYEALLSHLHAGMSADARFRDIRWYHKWEYEQDGEGATAPAGA